MERITTVKSVELRLPILYCEFCGQIHTDEAAAVERGCADGEPPIKYEAGTTVTARFTGADRLLVLAAGRIIAVFPPAHGKPGLDDIKISRLHGKMAGFTGFQAPLNRHEWNYLVAPLEGQGEAKDLKNEVFIESMLNPEPSPWDNASDEAWRNRAM